MAITAATIGGGHSNLIYGEAAIMPVLAEARHSAGQNFDETRATLNCSVFLFNWAL
jgi:hypothetical protein